MGRYVGKRPSCFLSRLLGNHRRVEQNRHSEEQGVPYVEEAANEIERLKAAGAEDVEINVTPSVPLNDETVAAYSRIGVHRLIGGLPQASEKERSGRSSRWRRTPRL